jgi:hypothetical protein
LAEDKDQPNILPMISRTNTDAVQHRNAKIFDSNSRSYSGVRYVSSCNPQGFEESARCLHSGYNNGFGRNHTLNMPPKRFSMNQNMDGAKLIKKGLSRDWPKISSQIEIVETHKNIQKW